MRIILTCVMLLTIACSVKAQAYPEQPPPFCQVMSAPSFDVPFVQLTPAPYDNSCHFRYVIERIRESQGKPVKGEFESTKDYEKRLDILRNVEVIPGVRASQRMALVVKGYPYHFTYDADKQLFQTSTVANLHGYVGKITEMTIFGHEHYAIPLEKDTRKTRSIGRNGFGVTREIDEEEGTAWALKPDPAWLAGDAPLNRTFPTLPVPASEAQEVKNKIAVVLIGSLDRIPVLDTTNVRAPDIQLPYSYYIKVHMLKFHPAFALVIRTDSGAVLARGSFDEAGVFRAVPLKAVTANTRSTSQEARIYDDPTQFCKAVKDTDKVDDSGVVDKRYVGPQSPPSISIVMKENFYWRCMDGKVYACYTGANGRACGKPILGNNPTLSLREYCASNPDATYIPGAANDTYMPWQCNGTTPSPDRSDPPPDLDKRGFVRGFWKQIPM